MTVSATFRGDSAWRPRRPGGGSGSVVRCSPELGQHELRRRYSQSTSGRSTSHRTSPSVSRSMTGQCSAGMRRPSSFHWLTAPLVTPKWSARLCIVPERATALSNASSGVIFCIRWLSLTKYSFPIRVVSSFSIPFLFRFPIRLR